MVSSEIDLPADYADLLEELKTRISGAWIHAQRTVNTLIIELHCSLGRDIIVRQESPGWGVASSAAWLRIWRSPFRI
ncbi:hypothetical protein [Arthrobacter sp. NPDC057009]|uniref:hypothetical protein n=1 Tax=Arthrobacter sp. NPDC057009 TaxID=3345996 RepID=UPI003641FE23